MRHVSSALFELRANEEAGRLIQHSSPPQFGFDSGTQTGQLGEYLQRVTPYGEQPEQQNPFIQVRERGLQ